MQREPSLSNLIGEEKLVYVEFILDYLSIGFNKYNINFYDWPCVIYGGARYKRESDGYKDRLCSAIGESVIDARWEADKYFSIGFSNGITIYLSLLEADREMPDAAVLNDTRNGSAIIVW